MTSKLTRDRLEKIKSWREIYGAGSNVILPAEEAEALALIALAAMDSEPVAWTDEEELRDVNVAGIGYLFGIDQEANKFADPRRQIMLYRHSQQPVVQCPFPCGWDNLNRLAIQDAAFVARALVAGEPATESVRQAAISNNDRLLKVISACRAAMLQAGNSTVIPDGYVMVPKEPTEEMLAAAKEWTGLTSTAEVVYIKMLAAAPQSPGSEPATVPGKWIPVSERMPENDGAYLCWDNRYVTTYAFIFGAWQANQFIAKNITHWMPLPAGPQEVR